MKKYYVIKSLIIQILLSSLIIIVFAAKYGNVYYAILILILIIFIFLEYNFYMICMSESELIKFLIFSENENIKFSDIKSIYYEGDTLKVGKIGITKYLVFTKKVGTQFTINIAKFNSKLIIEDLKVICEKNDIVYIEKK